MIGIVHDLQTGDCDYAVVRAASIMLFGLVVLRMAGLVRQQERSLERERALSGAGAELVAATERDGDRSRGRARGCLARRARRRGRAVSPRRGGGAVRRRRGRELGRAPSAGARRRPPSRASAQGDAAIRLGTAEALAAGLPPTHTRVLAVPLAPPPR